MNITVTLDDEYINELMKEAVTKIIKHNAYDYIRAAISGEVVKQANEIATSQTVKDEINTVLEEHVKHGIKERIQQCYIAEGYDSVRNGDLQTSKAIRDILYEHKDEIIEMVVERASKHVTNKANVLMMKKLLNTSGDER